MCRTYQSGKRINNRNPAIEVIHNNQTVEQNAKLFKTFFIVIAASVALCASSATLHSVNALCPSLLPWFMNCSSLMLNHIFNLQLQNSSIQKIQNKKQIKNKKKVFKRSKRYTVSVETKTMISIKTPPLQQ